MKKESDLGIINMSVYILNDDLLAPADVSVLNDQVCVYVCLWLKRQNIL